MHWRYLTRYPICVLHRGRIILTCTTVKAYCIDPVLPVVLIFYFLEEVMVRTARTLCHTVDKTRGRFVYRATPVACHRRWSCSVERSCILAVVRGHRMGSVLFPLIIAVRKKCLFCSARLIRSMTCARQKVLQYSSSSSATIQQPRSNHSATKVPIFLLSEFLILQIFRLSYHERHKRNTTNNLSSWSLQR